MTDTGSLQKEVERLRRQMEVNPSWETARLFKAAALALIEADGQELQKITGLKIAKLYENVSN